MLLICSFVLTIDNSGESPQIPTEVINFTNVSLTTNTRGVGESVKYLVSLGKEGLRNDGMLMQLFIKYSFSADMYFFSHDRNHVFFKRMVHSGNGTLHTSN